MDTIATARARLVRHSEVHYTASASSISVEPQDESGFTVSLHVARDRFTVAFDGWHEDFRTGEEALECFAFGLSDSSRLAVTYRGDTPTKWALESLEDGVWVPDSETGLLLVPFWHRARVVHRRNRIFSSASETSPPQP